MRVKAPSSRVSSIQTRSRKKAQGAYNPAKGTPFHDQIPGEIRNLIYEYCLCDSPIDIRRSPYIRGLYKGHRSLIHTSPLLRKEFHPLYSSKNQFQHTFTSPRALKTFLQHFLQTVPENSMMKIVIFFESLYSDLDFLPLFKLIDETCWKEVEVSFRCKDKPSTIAETMNRAIQQKALWQGSTSEVQRITLGNHNDTHLTVDLACGLCSKQAREERDNAAIVWSSLGFKVKPHHIWL